MAGIYNRGVNDQRGQMINAAHDLFMPSLAVSDIACLRTGSFAPLSFFIVIITM